MAASPQNQHVNQGIRVCLPVQVGAEGKTMVSRPLGFVTYSRKMKRLLPREGRCD